MENRCLAQLLSPVTVQQFFEQYWGVSHLLLTARDERGMTNLVTPHDLDVFFQSQQLPAAFLGVSRDGLSVPSSEWSRVSGPSGNSDRIALTERLFAFYAEGATLIVNNAHRMMPRLASYCRRMARELRFPVQANVYVTPPLSQGFSRHKDEHEVLVLQIHGSKNWTLFPHEAQAEHLALKPGDLLYIPRGLAHEAAAGGESSIHVTIGLHPVYPFELIEELALLARAHRDFQAPLFPVHLLAPQNKPVAPDFPEYLNSLIRGNSVADLAERRRLEALRIQEAGWPGRFLDAIGLASLNCDTVVQARNEQSIHVSSEGNTLKLEAGGSKVEIPAFLQSVADQLLAGEPIRVKDLRGLISEEGKLDLIQRLVGSGLLSIVR